MKKQTLITIAILVVAVINGAVILIAYWTGHKITSDTILGLAIFDLIMALIVGAIARFG